jgi:hypothetical protein
MKNQIDIYEVGRKMNDQISVPARIPIIPFFQGMLPAMQYHLQDQRDENL